MNDFAQRKLARQRERDAVHFRINPTRHEPSKAELRAQLAEAVRNTADLAHGKTRSQQAGSPQ